MNLKEIAEKAAPIIFSHEGDYGSVNKNDNRVLSGRFVRPGEPGEAGKY